MSQDDLPAEQRNAKEEWMEHRGFWTSVFDELLFLSPDYVRRYGELSSHPGAVLERRFKELLHIAVDCSTTHMYHRGTRSHINNAFDHGATLEEVLEVLILTSTIGVHTSTKGATLLSGIRRTDGGDERGPEGEEVADRFRDLSNDSAALARLDPAHLSHYANLRAVAWEHGPLDPVEKHLVLLAVEIAPTRSNDDAALFHMEQAADAGAGDEEILAVIETASVIGVHAMDGVTVLVEEASKRGMLPEELTAHPDHVTFRDPRY